MVIPGIVVAGRAPQADSTEQVIGSQAAGVSLMVAAVLEVCLTKFGTFACPKANVTHALTHRHT